MDNRIDELIKGYESTEFKRMKLHLERLKDDSADYEAQAKQDGTKKEDLKAEYDEAKKRKRLIQQSHIEFGNRNPEKKTMYGYNYAEPMTQILRLCKIPLKYIRIS